VSWTQKFGDDKNRTSSNHGETSFMGVESLVDGQDGEPHKYIDEEDSE
jgi:hypothetical protein